MNRLVSQKIRLIASLRADDSRKRRRARISRVSSLSHANAATDRLPPVARLPRPTIRDTSSRGPDTPSAALRIPERSWSLRARDDRGRLSDTAGGGLRRFPAACGSGRDSGRDWPHNVARYGRKHRGAVLRLCPLAWPARGFLPPKSQRLSAARDGGAQRPPRPRPPP